MTETFTVTIKRSSHSIDQLTDGIEPNSQYWGLDPELNELLSRLEEDAQFEGIESKHDFKKFDHGKFKQFQFPTIDVETLQTITYVCVTTAAGANFIKTLLDIIDKSLDVRKKLKDVTEYGSEHKELALEVKIGGATLDLEDAPLLKAKLEKFAAKQLESPKEKKPKKKKED
ncbi:hypothetical protein [Sinorhizobium meliloti]|uniref:hypothetical protein n=1 Tax=Rhizobium meliloti TaxID=382 RepID=UPI0020C09790|nr:hypothetical protein [Sinorhizobium meliloti]